MTAARVLARLAEDGGTLSFHHRPGLTTAADRLAGAVVRRRAVALDAVEAHLREAQHRYRWHRLDRSDWRLAPSLLWVGEPQLAAQYGVLDRVLSRLERDPGGFMGRRLVHAWLMAYAPGRPGMLTAAEAIRRALARGDAGLEEWHRAHRRFALFSPPDGPEAIARLALSVGLTESLEQAGLTGFHDGGFVGAVQRSLLFMIGRTVFGRDMTADHLAARLDSLDWQSPAAGLKNVLADALLGPWAGGGEPADDLRAVVTATIRRHLGEPGQHADHWQGVAPELVAMARLWLAHDALDRFYQQVEAGGHDDTWRYRKAFWLAYLRRGALDCVWLALGPHSATDGEARLIGGKRGQSALLMVIGSLVVMEWSHGGRCRAWTRTDAAALLPGQATYDARALRRSSLRIVRLHLLTGLAQNGGESWRWQDRMARFIRKRTGIDMTRAEGMPKKLNPAPACSAAKT
jgi:hypothetical protein